MLRDCSRSSAAQRDAREKLRPFVDLERDAVSVSSGPHLNLGSHEGVSVLLRTVVMNLLCRGSYRSIHQGLRELAYDIRGMLTLSGVAIEPSTA